nr:MAG TPA: hypothetical protein [Caudoviricetes sp.]
MPITLYIVYYIAKLTYTQELYNRLYLKLQNNNLY